MSAEKVGKVAVIGAGTMGHQISLCCALAGLETFCIDVSAEQLEKAEAFVKEYLPEGVSRGRFTEEQAAAAKQRQRFTTSLEEGAGEADFVIEAIVEKLEPKKELFRRLDEICPPQAILTTNSSFFVSSLLAPETGRPDRVCNMHFFNPALVMNCVEVVQGPHTSPETAAVVLALVRRLGKEPMLLHKEIYGFLVNRILRRILDEALFLFETGVASAEDIDSAVVNGLGHRIGPFALMDLIGIDLSYHVAMERYRDSNDPADKPSPTVVEKYVKGEWGRKKGRGFYSYGK